MAISGKPESSDSAKERDTILSLLKPLLFDLVIDAPRYTGIAVDVKFIDRVLTALKGRPTSDFKALMNEGLAAKKHSFRSAILGMDINPMLAIRIGAAFSKYPSSATTDKKRTRDKALLTLVESELSVRQFEETKLPALVQTPLFFEVRKQLRKLLSEFDAADVISDLRFGPGVTSTPNIKLNSQKNAWILRNNGVVFPEYLYEYFANRGLLKVVARSSYELATDIVHFKERDYVPPQVYRSVAKVEECITTVPKDATTDRPISTFPVGATLISVAANSTLGRAINLVDRRVEFTYQSKCAGMLDDYLKEWNDWSSTSTVDLKDASGNISWMLLEQVVDNSDVLELLRVLRGSTAVYSIKVELPTHESLTVVNPGITVKSKNISASLRHVLGPHDSRVNKAEVSEADLVNIALAENEWLRKLVSEGVPVSYDIERHSKFALVTVHATRYSHAGMGSGVTFPILAALIAAILRASNIRDYRVFGDDIILVDCTPKETDRVLQNLELFGLKVNVTKSCRDHNPIREAVGTWWYNAPTGIQNFTPLYFRKDLGLLLNPVSNGAGKTKCSDLSIIHYAVMLHNYATRTGHSELARFLADVLVKNSAVPVSRVPVNSGLFGLEVPVDELWDWYSPIFKDGVLTRLRQRLEKSKNSFTNGIATVDRVQVVRTDEDLQVLYVQVKEILASPFKGGGASAFVDADILPQQREFEQDPIFESLGILRESAPIEELKEWMSLVSFLKTSVDCESTDRPPKDKTVFHQKTSRLEIPDSVIQSWEGQGQLPAPADVVHTD